MFMNLASTVHVHEYIDTLRERERERVKVHLIQVHKALENPSNLELCHCEDICNGVYIYIYIPIVIASKP